MNDYPDLPGYDYLLRWVARFSLYTAIFFLLDSLIFCGTVLVGPILLCTLLFGPLAGWIYWAFIRATINIDHYFFKRR